MTSQYLVPLLSLGPARIPGASMELLFDEQGDLSRPLERSRPWEQAAAEMRSAFGFRRD